MPYSAKIAALMITVSCVTALLVKYMIPWLIAKQQVDMPNHRTLHTGNIPRGGGLIVVLMAVVALLWASYTSYFPNVYLALLVLVSGWATLGWCDDVYSLSTRLRLGVQLLLALAAIALIGWVDHLVVSASVSLALGWWGAPLTVLAMVWMVNLYNFMDGMDGMAASQAIVASTTFAFWFMAQGGTELAVFAAVVAAASYGFLWHNWRPASVFMGDVGSIGLGAIFALLCVIGHNRFGVPVLSSIMLFGVFIADTTITLVLRLRRGEKLWQAHSSHFYQRLAHAGYAHSSIILTYIGLMLVCSLAATVSFYQPALLLPAFLLLSLLLLCCARWVSAQSEQIQS